MTAPSDNPELHRGNALLQHLDIPLQQHHLDLLGMTMPEALDHAATRWGDRIAIKPIEGGRAPDDMAQLRDAMSRFRTGLTDAGMQPGDRVGVLLEEPDGVPRDLARRRRARRHHRPTQPEVHQPRRRVRPR